jgi:ABC-type transport system involved in multi-copper enzyme maturation permease subunit
VLKLMKLEIKKVKMGGYIRGALIANLVIIALLALLIFASRSEGDVEFTSFTFTFSIVDTMVKATFIVFASVLIARFIIEEYKSNTITVLFMYPINRKKLIVAKLLIIVLFTFISMVISNIFIDFILCVINNFYNFIPDKLNSSLVLTNLVNICTNALACTGMGLIPLYFGMRKKSASTTIVSSILIVTIVCSNNGGHSLSNIIAIPISLSIIGVFIAYLSIRNIEHIDVIK